MNTGNHCINLYLLSFHLVGNEINALSFQLAILLLEDRNYHHFFFIIIIMRRQTNKLWSGSNVSSC